MTLSFLLGCALASDPIAQSAYAISTAKSPSPAVAPIVQPGQTVTRKIELPVTWQLTKSRMAGTTNATITETFRETWTLEMQGAGVYFLRSPRAVVPVYPTDGANADAPADQTESNDSTMAQLPKGLTVSEGDFAKLVGIPQNDVDAENSGNGIDRPVAIPLQRQKKPDSEILLSWSEDEHYAVQIEIATPSTF